MSSGQKTVTAFLTMIGGLLLTILGLSRHWPWWTWAAVAAGLLLVPFAVILLADRRRDPFPPELLREPDLPVPPVERRELRITDVLLPSALDDYDFRFSATVRWCPLSAPPGAAPVNGGGLAVDAILERARRVSATRRPGRSSLVQHRLNGELATMVEDSTGRVQAMAFDVTLVLADQDRERLAKLAAVRKDEEVWEHERKYEQSRRAYLGKDVLADTGSAVVWWLHRNDDRIDKTVKDLGLLAQLTSAANDKDIDPRLRHLVPGGPDPDPDEPPTPEPDGPGPDSPPGTPYGSEGATESSALMDAYTHLLHQMGHAPDDPECSLIHGLIADLAEARSPEEAAALRARFGMAAGPPSSHVNGSGPPADAPF
jgi:hypothetical protein